MFKIAESNSVAEFLFLLILLFDDFDLPILPGRFSQFNWTVSDVFAIHLAHCFDKIFWISERNESVSF